MQLSLDQPDRLSSRGLTVLVVRENGKVASLKWQVGDQEAVTLAVRQGPDGAVSSALRIEPQLGENFRVGVGYNFTAFSDDLRLLDYDNKGVFLNVTGAF